MQRRTLILPIFFICFIIAIIIFFIGKSGSGPGFTGFIEQMSVPLQRTVFSWFHTTKAGVPAEVDSLQEENKKLLMQLVTFKELEKENKALKDQLNTTDPAAENLFPAQVIGMRDEELIIDKGSDEKMAVGDIIVIKDIVIGQVVKTSKHLSVVNLLTHRSTSFTAETVKTSALGVVKGKGGDEIFLENVVLSDNLEKNDLVKTKGDVNKDGKGYPPGLVVGKVISVNKKTSALFQTAEVQSLVDFSRLTTVFVMQE